MAAAAKTEATKSKPSRMARTAHTEAARFDPKIFLAKVGNGTTSLNSAKKHVLFSQGDAANAVFYIQTGRVKLTVVSQQG